MCTLRAIFIIENNKILFSNRFPLVEKKIKIIDKNYLCLPNDILIL